jgi:hypothetical protein
MKTTLLLFLLATNFDFFCQTSSYTLNENNVSAHLRTNGVLFLDSLTQTGKYFVPKDDNISIIYSSEFWYAGKDEDNVLRLAGSRYADTGQDFFGGPFSSNDSYENTLYKSKYTNSIWTVTKNEINFHILNYLNPNYIPSNNIMNWPGNGDMSLGVVHYLAPFIDLNNNGIYEPLLGDYPCILGDKASYIIQNDDANIHGETAGEKLGIEIHTMLYQFKAENFVDNTTFIKVKIFNRGGHTLNNFITSFFSDPDLGNYSDDFFGVNVQKNLSFWYNADDFDEQVSTSLGYRDNPPAAGIISLNHNLSSSMGFRIANSINMSFPTNAPHIYNCMNGLWKNGQPMYLGGDGYTELPDSSSEVTKFLYTGNPMNGDEWSLVSNNTYGSDISILSSIEDGVLEPNGTKVYDYAILFARKTNTENYL